MNKNEFSTFNKLSKQELQTLDGGFAVSMGLILGGGALLVSSIGVSFAIGNAYYSKR